MNWLDILLVALVTGAGALGIARGFGRAAFDALGLYAALCIAAALAPPAAGVLFPAPGGPGAASVGLALGLALAVTGAAGLTAAWFLAGALPVHAGLFDKMLGLAAGLGAGLAVAHGLVSVVVTADPHRRAAAALVRAGGAGEEVYSFPAYHAAMDALTGAGSYRRSLPNVSGR